MKSSHSTARDVFSYILMIVTMTISVIFFGVILWQYINVLFPDPVDYYYSSITELIRTGISALLVAWPIFLLISWSIQRDLFSHAEKVDMWVRKWLLYLTLFVAAIVSMIDLISIINSFLSGELTLRFALKVLVVLIIASAVFMYFGHELRRDITQPARYQKPLAIGVSIIILVAIISGFFIVGSPSYQRDLRLDEQRVEDLDDIEWRVLSYWNDTETLPSSLDELDDPTYYEGLPTDPDTSESYTYHVLDAYSFELCATFSQESPSVNTNHQKPMWLEEWEHASGTQCFVREVDPDRSTDDEPEPIMIR